MYIRLKKNSGVKIEGSHESVGCPSYTLDCHCFAPLHHSAVGPQSHTPGPFWCEEIENVPLFASELQVEQLFETWEPQHVFKVAPYNQRLSIFLTLSLPGAHKPGKSHAWTSLV